MMTEVLVEAFAIDDFAGYRWRLIYHSSFPENKKAYIVPDYT